MEFDKKGFYKELGLRLQLHRKRIGKTQEEVATGVGVPRASYANLETGRHATPIDLVWRAAVVLGVRLDDVVPEFTPRSSPTPRASADGTVGTAPYTIVLPPAAAPRRT